MPVPVRSLVGPALLAGGVWAAAGTIAPSADLATRLAIPAPVWWLPAAFALGTAIPAVRRQPLLAGPALLPLIPWLPLPLPWPAFIWTGAAAWIPVALALAAAALASRPDRPRQLAVDHAMPLGPVVRAALLTLCLALTTAWWLAPRLPGGDEPHYLVITQSLLIDADLRIENNHTRRDYAAYAPGTLPPHYLRRGRDNAIYSVHAPGVPALVAPLFSVFGYRGAQATILLLASLAGGLVWMSAWLASRDRRSSWFAWAAVTTTTTFLIQSVTIFPDGPGAAFVAAAVAFVMALAGGQRPSRATLMLVSGLLAALPFLHSRFVVLSVLLGLLVVWLLVRGARRRGESPWTRVATFLVLPVIGSAAWFGYFWWIYGTFDPSAPYGTNPETSLAYVPGGLLGLLVDQQFGLLTYGPVLAAVALGWRGSPDRELTFTLRILGVIVIAYLAAVATYWMWWAGVPATPARFAMAILPALAPPAAVAWARAGIVGRNVLLVLLAATMAMTTMVVGVEHGALAWNARGTRAAWIEWLGASADLARIWPSFFWRLTPPDVWSERPFVLHVVVWMAAFALVAWGMSWSRRLSNAMSVTQAAARAGWWLPVGITCAGVTAVTIDGTGGWAPVSAQVRVLSGMAAGAVPLEIGPLHLQRSLKRPADLPIVIPRDGPPTADGPWQAIRLLPPGRYDVVVKLRRPTGGRLVTKLGATPLPDGAWALERQSQQSRSILLPAGASVFAIDGDAMLQSAGNAIELIPREIWPADRPYAVAAASTAEETMYFLDANTYVEPDGFWVRGESAAQVVFAMADPASQGWIVDVANGGVANVVTIRIAGVTERRALAASESWRLPVTAGPRDLIRLEVASEAGFRPSAMNLGTDDRYLGARIRLVPGARPDVLPGATPPTRQ